MASDPAPAVLVAFHCPHCHPPLSVLSWESQRGPGMPWWSHKYQAEGVHPFPRPPSCVLARTAQNVIGITTSSTIGLILQIFKASG